MSADDHANANVAPRRHSESEFGEQRDYWWNADFLRLLAERWELQRLTKVLDVGCGVGHWGRALMHVLPPTARITGIDREGDWVTEARRLADQAGFGQRCTYLQASADALPFADDEFGMVTCQTLLIHVAEPCAVLVEMIRVLNPGGLLVLVEPNNAAGQLVASNVSAEMPITQTIERLAFYLTCEHGRTACGEGNLSVGDLLPGLLREFGLHDVRVDLLDKARPLLPPYESPEQRALIRQLTDDLDHGISAWWGWTEDEAERYWRAGGGAASDFHTQWMRRLTEERTFTDGMAQCRFHTGGGDIAYVISARR